MCVWGGGGGVVGGWGRVGVCVGVCVLCVCVCVCVCMDQAHEQELLE